MKKKFSLTLDNEFIQFCKLNDITDIEKKAKEVFNSGFNLLKYGDNPTKIKALLTEEGKEYPYIPIADTLTKKKKDDLYD